MNQLHCGVKQLKIGKTRGVLHSFVWNHVKYANMEGFRRDSHICTYVAFRGYLMYTYVAACSELFAVLCICMVSGYHSHTS